MQLFFYSSGSLYKIMKNVYKILYINKKNDPEKNISKYYKYNCVCLIALKCVLRLYCFLTFIHIY